MASSAAQLHGERLEWVLALPNRWKPVAAARVVGSGCRPPPRGCGVGLWYLAGSAASSPPPPPAESIRERKLDLFPAAASSSWQGKLGWASAAAPKVKAAAAAKPKATVVGVKKKAVEKPKLKPMAKAVKPSAKVTPCEEGCPAKLKTVPDHGIVEEGDCVCQDLGQRIHDVSVVLPENPSSMR
ncbi:hypothetical protein NL676_037138 [Syzygium grande]|nr:hypothetical protein NL676_037138 [Syzygium grande]